MANITVKPKVDKLLTSDENAGAIGTGLVSHRTALEALGVGTAGFVATGTSVGNVPVLLAATTTGGNAKLPVLDGSNLTGLSEIPELHPTHLILNELGTAIAPNNTLAYNGDFLSRHNGSITGGNVLSNIQTTRYPASVIKNKTILRKKVAAKPNGDPGMVRLSIKVNGPHISGSAQLGILQVYACWANTDEAVPDTGRLDSENYTINKFYLFNNVVYGDNTVTNNTVLQMRYEIDASILSGFSVESIATKISNETSSSGPYSVISGAQTRTTYLAFDPSTIIYDVDPKEGATRDLVVQASIFSHDRLHVGTYFAKGSGLPYVGVLWYDTTTNTLNKFSSSGSFEQYKINNIAVAFYYSATEAGAIIPTYALGKYIIFGDKDYYKKGEDGIYVTKYNYLENVTDEVTFDTTLSIITTLT